MKIRKDVSLRDILFYKIGGKTRWLLDASSTEDIVEAVEFVQANKIEKYMILGLGANVLVPDEDYDGAIIRIRKTSGSPDIRLTSDGLVVAFAGQTLEDLINFSFENNLLGLEVLGGLPSTIGGAIRGNAGAFGVEMKDVLEKVTVLEVLEDGFKTREFTLSDCEFSYRDSIFKRSPKYIILKGFFHLERGTDEEIERAKKVYQEQIDYRKKHHPVEYPSCGSVFKNIRDKDEVEKILSVWPDIRYKVESNWHGKVSMGYVIGRLGFTGLQIGGAKVSEKHANYISNVESAKAVDVREIIRKVSLRFEQTFGFTPELEAQIV